LLAQLPVPRQAHDGHHQQACAIAVSQHRVLLPSAVDQHQDRPDQGIEEQPAAHALRRVEHALALIAFRQCAAILAKGVV
jgi:hypothetical protein